MFEMLDVDVDNDNGGLIFHHPNTSTANQEINNGNEKDLQHKSECNETMSANNNRVATSSTTAKRTTQLKIKRE